MPSVLVYACKTEDFDASTQTCAAPFWTYPPSAFPELTVEEGFQLACAIVGVWTIGLIARLTIRAGQPGRYSH
ncbi:hypothetical protein LK996_09235 [Lysobacter sp. A6]|uniref:Uncharacterized protein n=1 Tax=Noviluteimonas lactosilytica TaxID=2888523 RepID=A0ABS8JI55_9GAMM|nr:hypothetical protein [Lysobacter lactosilyticus]MCC8363257.1 hypothetical protein [Lysobacter lactosilyticus]